MSIVKKALAALLVGAMTAGAAQAAELVGNAPFAVTASGWQSDQGTLPYEQTFVTPADTVLEAIRWWGFHGQDSQGASFDQLVVMLDGVVQTGVLTVVAGPLFTEYTLDITDAKLTASALSIFNDSPDVEWYWQSAAAVGNPDAPDDRAVAFSLLGRTGDLTVSEPGGAGLALAALAGLAWVRRRHAP
jgi:MYXO-CTERM domain-containing protein